MGFVRSSALFVSAIVLDPVCVGRLQRYCSHLLIVPNQAWLEMRKHTLLPTLAKACFVLYLIWNCYWLLRGKTPPSLLVALFGVPCPTTGCSRSLAALLRGDLRSSVLWNPFALPILALFTASLLILFSQAVRRAELVLPKWMGTAWAGLLAAAWLLKFLLGPAYW